MPSKKPTTRPDPVVEQQTHEPQRDSGNTGPVKLDMGNLPEVDPNAPLIGDYLADAAVSPIDPTDEEPTLPGFSMSDEPDIPEEFTRPPDDAPLRSADEPIESWRPPDTGQTPRSYSEFMNNQAAATSPSGNFLPPLAALPVGGKIRYEGRVRVIEAWCFNGRIQEAPPFVDRNWLAYGSHDDERSIPEGPMIQMPNPSGKGPDRLCRIGDYVVKQEVLLEAGRPTHITVEVWHRDEFEKVFIPIPVEEGNENAMDPPGDHSQAA